MRRTRNTSVVAAVVAVLSMLMANVAFADTVVNDVTTTGEIVSVTKGGSAVSAGWKIVESGSEPAGDRPGCNVGEGGNSATMTPRITAPSGGSLTGVAVPAAQTAIACNVVYAFSFSAASTAAAGDYAVAVTVTGGKDNSLYSYAAAPFTLRVVEPVASDTTPPSISYTLNPTTADGANGWYKSAVTLTWTVTENESASSLVKTGCVDQNITADQAATTYSCSATSDGGSATQVNVSLKKDGTAPSAPTVTALPAANPDGWNNSNVTVTFSGAGDNISGVASCTAQETISAETTADGVTRNGTCTDNAGNTSTQTGTRTIKIDKTAPTSSVTGVIDGATYIAGSANPTCSGNDALSGIASHGTLSTVDNTTAGLKTVSCSGATDRAGNTQSGSSDSVSYTIVTIGSFNSNFDGSAVLKVKPNQAIPLKWALSNGTSNLALLSSATLSSVSSTRCTNEAGINGTDLATETAAGASGLQLLPDNSYQMNWKATSTTGCRALTVTMNLTAGGSHSRTILVNIAK